MSTPTNDTRVSPRPNLYDLCYRCGKRFGEHYEPWPASTKFPLWACPLEHGVFSYSSTFEKIPVTEVPAGDYTPGPDARCVLCAQPYHFHLNGTVAGYPPHACPMSGGSFSVHTGFEPVEALPTPMRHSALLAAVEKARESARVHELDLRAALSAATSSLAWFPLYDLVRPLVGIVERLDAVGARLQEGGSK